VYKVAYSQIVDHPALNETRRGFLEGLKQSGFVEGQNLTFLYQNAQGDVGNARNIAEKFLADGVDVLTPCTTPNVQATVRVAKGTRTPVVFACVTDPVATGILESIDRPSGTNVTGVYNPLPIAELFDLFLRIQPGLKTAGTIYNASEGNSQVINRQAKAEAERRGLKWVEVTIAGSADVRTAAESLIGKIDAFILGQDNTVASAFEAVVKVAQDRQVPLFSMDTQAPARGAIASLAASNYEQGLLWAKELVAPVLLGTDPATVTPVRPRVFDLQVNLQAASAAKLTIPKDIVDRASKVHGR
jgi:putative ABC transport system substrate-binding protein